MMNLNKFLCSHFEPNEDGKVTIGHIVDIVLKISIIAFMLCIGTIWIGGLFVHACKMFAIISEADISQYFVDGEIISSMIFLFLAGLLSLILFGIIITVLLLAGYIFDKICSIEIASCTIKKEDDDVKEENK